MSARTDVSAEPEQIEQSSWRDFAVRILFGGSVAVVAYLVGQRFGPSVAGLFLAFPAIMPASVTLVEKHAGKQKAVNASRGTMAGTLGLLAFGAAVWLFGSQISAWLVLTVASLAWLVFALGGWLALEWLMAETHDESAD